MIFNFESKRYLRAELTWNGFILKWAGIYNQKISKFVQVKELVVVELKNGRNVLQSSKHENESRLPFSPCLSTSNVLTMADHRAFLRFPELSGDPF